MAGYDINLSCSAPDKLPTYNTNLHRSLPTQQDWQVLWLGLVAQVWWFQIKQA